MVDCHFLCALRPGQVATRDARRMAAPREREWPRDLSCHVYHDPATRDSDHAEQLAWDSARCHESKRPGEERMNLPRKACTLYDRSRPRVMVHQRARVEPRCFCFELRYDKDPCGSFHQGGGRRRERSQSNPRGAKG